VGADRADPHHPAGIDDEHVRQIQAVTLETRERVVVTVLATTTVTAQLWDFGVSVDSMDWPPPPASSPRNTSHPAPGTASRAPTGGPGDSWARSVIAADRGGPPRVGNNGEIYEKLQSSLTRTTQPSATPAQNSAPALFAIVTAVAETAVAETAI
jgi:hypothetical protein